MHAGEDGTERDTREDVWVVALSWIELATVEFYHVKRASTRKHTSTLYTVITPAQLNMQRKIQQRKQSIASFSVAYQNLCLLYTSDAADE